MLWSWRCFGHFRHKRLRRISSVFNGISKILGDFVRFSAILADFQRFWATCSDLGQFRALLGHSWALLGALGTLLGLSWGAFGMLLEPLGRLLDASCEKKQLVSVFWAPTWDPKSSQVGSKIIQRSTSKIIQ